MVCSAYGASGRAGPLHHSFRCRSRNAGVNPTVGAARQKDEIFHPSVHATSPFPTVTSHAWPRGTRLIAAASPFPDAHDDYAASGTALTTDAAALPTSTHHPGFAVAASAAHSPATAREGAPCLPAAVVLGIESSCDDTGVAVVTSDGRVLGEAIATQADVHAQWGGVVPNLARDAHAAAIDRTVDSALAAAGMSPRQLSAVAVTIGPGLGLCLRVGVAKARQLARQYGLPLVSVHHMEAHALVARLPLTAAAAASPAVRMAATVAAPPATAAPTATEETRGSAGSGSPQQLQVVSQQEEGATQQRTQLHSAAEASSSGCAALPGAGSAVVGNASGPDPDAVEVLADIGAAAAVPFPFLCLLVSGGHNLLVLVRGVGKYVQLGTTVDDALGEAYDKVARLLNLELRPHGGAALEALAREGDPRAFRFAVPMRKHATCDFSFAGLKTNTRLAIEQQLAPERTSALTTEQLRKVKADIAASFQSVAVTHLTEKTRRGVTWARELVPELRHLVVAGGVACNQVVRGSLQQLAEDAELELVLPPPRWCTDNGVMVAWAGIERLALGWAEPPPPPLPAPAALRASSPGPAEQHQLVLDAGRAAASACQTELSGAGPSGAEVGLGSESEAEWVELKPRWPLTSELHPRSAAAQLEQRRSLRRVRLHTPLSDWVPPAASAAVPKAGGAPPGVAGSAAAAGMEGAEAAVATAGSPADRAPASGRDTAGSAAGVEAGSLVGAGV